jgi:hypothetical protein
MMNDLDKQIVAQFRARIVELKAGQVKAKERVEQCQAEQAAWQRNEQQATAELIGLSRSVIEIEKVLAMKTPEPPKSEQPKE